MGGRPARVRRLGGVRRRGAVRDRGARRQRRGVPRRGRAGAPARGGQLARRRGGARARPARGGRLRHRALPRRVRGRERAASSRTARCSSRTGSRARCARAGRGPSPAPGCGGCCAGRSSPTRSGCRRIRRTRTSRRWSTAPASTPCSTRSADFRFAGPVRVPVTIAWGTRDGLLLPSQALRARRVLPEARHLWLRGCGHVPMSDDPAQVAAVLLSGSATPVSAAVRGGAVERRALKGSAAGAGRPPAAAPDRRGATSGRYPTPTRPTSGGTGRPRQPTPRAWGALTAIYAVMRPTFGWNRFQPRGTARSAPSPQCRR